jgi:hypothetical protein
MKMKSDFVTNSSSCSFVAWGITMYMSDIKEKYGARIFSILKEQEQKAKDAKAKERGAFMIVATAPDVDKLKEEYKEFMEGDTRYDEIEDAFVGLELESLPDEDDVMIGVSPFSMKDDQTLAQFKQEICDKFKYVGIEIKPEELGAIEESWENR